MILGKADTMKKNNKNELYYELLSNKQLNMVEYIRRRYEHMTGLATGISLKISTKISFHTGDIFVDDNSSTTSISSNPEIKKLCGLMDRKYFKELLKIKHIRPILNIIAMAVQGKHDGPEGTNFKDKRFFIFIDPDSNSTAYLDAKGNEDYLGYYVNNLIKLGTKTSTTNNEYCIRGTLIHELIHFVAAEIFKNGCRPYYKNDKDTEEYFNEICDELQQKINNSEKIDQILEQTFKQYEKNKWPNELIARAGELIVTKEDGLDLLKTQSPKLYDYFVKYFIPRCKQHFDYLLKKATNEFMKQFSAEHSEYLKSYASKHEAINKSTMISKVKNDSDYSFDEDRWIVSKLIINDNEKGKDKKKRSTPHAKVVIEGIDNSLHWLMNDANPTQSSLYIGEFHIHAAETTETQDTNKLKKTLGLGKKYTILYTERSFYKDDEKLKQYKESGSKSYRIKTERAKKIIKKIKDLKKEENANPKSYLYAGSHSMYNLFLSKENRGENCITWCEKMLETGGIKRPTVLKDLKKADPVAHLGHDNTKEDLKPGETSKLNIKNIFKFKFKKRR